MTRDELLKRFPNASPAFLRNNASDCPVVRQSPAPVVERDLWHGPLEGNQNLNPSTDCLCVGCGKEFIPKQHKQPSIYVQKYCSQKCAASHIGKQTMATNRQIVPTTQKIECVCETCGKKFSRWKSNIMNGRTFCSYKCSAPHTAMTGSKTRHAKGLYAAEKSYTRGSKGWVNIGGKSFFARSSWEANYGRFLQFLKDQGQIKDWEHEPETFWFDGIKRGVLSYLPDFRVTEVTGGIVYHEVKGWMDSKSKTKIKRMAKYHPDVRLLVIDAKKYKALQKTVKQIVPDWGKPTSQQKVISKEEERTEVTIERMK